MRSTGICDGAGRGEAAGPSGGGTVTSVGCSDWASASGAFILSSASILLDGARGGCARSRRDQRSFFFPTTLRLPPIAITGAAGGGGLPSSLVINGTEPLALFLERASMRAGGGGGRGGPAGRTEGRAGAR